MLSVVKQIESARLVCPVTYQPLVIRGDRLESRDRLHRYPFVNGVPILFADIQMQREYLEQEGGGMNREYLAPPAPNRAKLFTRSRQMSRSCEEHT